MLGLGLSKQDTLGQKYIFCVQAESLVYGIITTLKTLEHNSFNFNSLLHVRQVVSHTKDVEGFVFHVEVSYLRFGVILNHYLVKEENHVSLRPPLQTEQLERLQLDPIVNSTDVHIQLYLSWCTWYPMGKPMFHSHRYVTIEWVGLILPTPTAE